MSLFVSRRNTVVEDSKEAEGVLKRLGSNIDDFFVEQKDRQPVQFVLGQATQAQSRRSSVALAMLDTDTLGSSFHVAPAGLSDRCPYLA